MRSEELQLLTDTMESGLTVQSSSLNLDGLSDEWSELSSLAQALSANLSHWNLYQSAVSRLMPCLSEAEQCVSAAKDGSGSDVTVKTGGLAEAQKLLDDYRVCSFHSHILIVFDMICMCFACSQKLTSIQFNLSVCLAVLFFSLY